MGGSRGDVASGSAVWEFEARWTRFSGLSKAGNLWVGFLSPSGPEISRDLLSSIEESFRSSGTQTLGEAIDRLTPGHHEQQILVALFALIHQGRLKANLRERLTEKTNLKWEGRGNATIAS